MPKSVITVCSHEYKSIVEDAAKLQKETEYRHQKMIVRKLVEKSKMQYYHEALNNARKNPKDTWNLLRQLVPGKSKQINCNFQNPTISASLGRVIMVVMVELGGLPF